MDIDLAEPSPGEGTSIDVGESLAIPMEFSATVADWAESGDPSTVTLTARWDQASFTYEVVRLTYDAADGYAITGSKLRELPVATILRELTKRAVLLEASVPNETTTYQYAVAADDISPSADLMAIGSREGPTPEVLARVALIHMYARILQDPPTKAVADAFQIPHRTASHWVKLARERGHLAG